MLTSVDAQGESIKQNSVYVASKETLDNVWEYWKVNNWTEWFWKRNLRFEEIDAPSGLLWDKTILKQRQELTVMNDQKKRYNFSWREYAEGLPRSSAEWEMSEIIFSVVLIERGRA